MKQLFQYAVILHKYDKDGAYEDSVLIIDPTVVLAKDQKDVLFKVTRLIPEEHATNPDNVQILVRPF